MVEYVIWHDNDFDFALWVYENSILKSFPNVIIRSIPKSNSEKLIKSKFSNKNDYYLMCAIKYATPDLIIQKNDEKGTKILFCSEFMTQTPQHDHVFQRFERIYCISKLKIPVAFVFSESKCKLEKDKKVNKYIPKYYSPNPLAVHTYLKTGILNNNPTLMFFWPQKEGYLKYDQNHQTAPKIEGDIISWFEFLNKSIEKEGENLNDEYVVKNQVNYMNTEYLLKDGKKFLDITHDLFLKNFQNYYNLSRIKILDTNEVITQNKLDTNKLSKSFLNTDKTLVFEYDSKLARTTPYCGFICGLFNLFCIDDKGNKVLNLIHKPNYTNYKGELSSLREDVSLCPFENFENFEKYSLDEIQKHKCIYYESQYSRIFLNIPDLNIIGKDIFYN